MEITAGFGPGVTAIRGVEDSVVAHASDQKTARIRCKTRQVIRRPGRPALSPNTAIWCGEAAAGNPYGDHAGAHLCQSQLLDTCDGGGRGGPGHAIGGGCSSIEGQGDELAAIPHDLIDILSHILSGPSHAVAGRVGIIAAACRNHFGAGIGDPPDLYRIIGTRQVDVCPG